MASQGHATVAQLCFGRGNDQLNLSAVQQRVTELIRVIDTLLMEMQTQGAHWVSFLDKLAVINMTHMQIMTEIRPLLRQYIVYPKFVDNPGIENQLPELLASRLLPEQVDQETAWRTDMPYFEYLATQPSLVLETAHAQIAELQDLVAWLTRQDHMLKYLATSMDTESPVYQQLRAATGVLDAKGKQRKEIDAMSAEIAKAAEAAAAARRQAGGGVAGQQHTGVTSVVVGQKRKGPDKPGAQAAATDGPPPSEDDALIAMIMSGELWPKQKR